MSWITYLGDNESYMRLGDFGYNSDLVYLHLVVVPPLGLDLTSLRPLGVE